MTEAFGERVAPYRKELEIHCYRLLGSTLDAEDAVQETMLRAYRRRDSFVQEISFRAWLYKIATNVCLDQIGKRRRTLPTVDYPATGPGAPLPAPADPRAWIEPWPGGIEGFGVAGPAARVEARESITLAFVTALQQLTPRQRAVLLLRDVLAFRARETAAILEMSVPAVNSALHRGRTALDRHYSRAKNGTAAPAEVDARLLARYVAAWERADVDALVALLREEATLAMPPWPVWWRGRAAIAAGMRRDIFAGWTPGQDRLHPLVANGQPALALYRRAGAATSHQGIGVQVLGVAPGSGHIGHITVFLNPGLLPGLGLPETLS